ncbi:hypothetical protein DSM106972_018860 [Dulcicalothrix desertica PCC 7102]|uniref:Rad50/SbcC-type AAA domain-containing protein n=1 Tax=Dulcicalothrix desertica PCC 7102 TaxID=232991 RepID=A0A3S1CSA6_9CYAN|nr:AAA family ATPase [Dulcicalothrix desertica]RUT07626.1 hypothetical protein DSM106972_018860 [Dulcicalothrix desertica PCC 7102]TWH39795.1 DNA sulfur modification protein DndD [Dulcicalothrix desertica PCC 7102]
MKIEIIGWKSEGLRCPDVEINLIQADNKPARVTLIQMPNGTGKTTTLTMIRAALTGEARTWTKNQILDLRRPSDDNSQGLFILNLRIDDKPLTFEVELDFEIFAAKYRTTAPGSGGITEGWKPPSSVLMFLSDKFIPLFIFDGEYANDLLDHNKSEASQAIDALFQLYLLEDIKNIAQRDWDESTKHKSSSSITLTKRQNKVSSLKRRIKAIEAEKSQLEKKIASLEPEVINLEQKISDNISNTTQLNEEYQIVREQELKAINSVSNSASNLMNILRKPHALHEAFANSLLELRNQLDKLKLPASTSRQFFLELLDEPDCICGRPLDETTCNTIRQRSVSYLAEDTSGFLNTLKNNISSQLMHNDNQLNNQLVTSVEELSSNIISRDLAILESTNLKRRLIEQGDEELKQWQQSLDMKKQELQKLESKLKEINRPQSPADKDLDDQKCLQALKNFHRDAEAELAEITETRNLYKKTEILKRIIDKSLQKSRANLRISIVKDCNDKLETVLYQDPIRIKEVDRSLKLLNQTSGSAGQVLSVGYIFLTTLLNRGQHQFPLVVDSPANPISIAVRRQIGKLIPSLCNQFIAFTISSERAGFTESLYANCPDDIKFITLFRKTNGTNNLIDMLPKQGVITSSNAVLVEGKKYFNSFDLVQDTE